MRLAIIVVIAIIVVAVVEAVVITEAITVEAIIIAICIAIVVICIVVITETPRHCTSGKVFFLILCVKIFSFVLDYGQLSFF